MNKKQKIVIVLGLFAFLGAGLFPPYQTYLPLGGDWPRFPYNPELDAYHIYDTPSGYDVDKASREAHSYHYRLVINMPRYLFTLSSIILTTIVLALVLSTRPTDP